MHQAPTLYHPEEYKPQPMQIVEKVTGLPMFNNVTIEDESISKKVTRKIKIFLSSSVLSSLLLGCHLIVHWGYPT